MTVLYTILSGIIVLAVLVVVHEGGHFLVAKAFGVRVTEFMIGLPGPRVGFMGGETRFGVTAIPLGGYARVCGMEPGPIKPYLKEVLFALSQRKTANMEDIAEDCGISDDEAYDALEELVQWGSATGPTRKDKFNTYRFAVPDNPDPDALYARELSCQYRSLPFWKRSLILVAGPFANLLLALIVFVVLFSVVGFDITSADGTVNHITVDVWKSVVACFSYVWMVVQAVAQLFNPVTAGDIISDSTSVIGIAVVSKQAFDLGVFYFFEFAALISISLAIMNLVPIPPLDGGKFLVELVEKIIGRNLPEKASSVISLVGIILFLVLFAVLMWQDVQRFIFGTIM